MNRLTSSSSSTTRIVRVFIPLFYSPDLWPRLSYDDADASGWQGRYSRSRSHSFKTPVFGDVLKVCDHRSPSVLDGFYNDLRKARVELLLIEQPGFLL